MMMFVVVIELAVLLSPSSAADAPSSPSSAADAPSSPCLPHARTAADRARVAAGVALQKFRETRGSVRNYMQENKGQLATVVGASSGVCLLVACPHVAVVYGVTHMVGAHTAVGSFMLAGHSLVADFVVGAPAGALGAYVAAGENDQLAQVAAGIPVALLVPAMLVNGGLYATGQLAAGPGLVCTAAALPPMCAVAGGVDGAYPLDEMMP